MKFILTILLANSSSNIVITLTCNAGSIPGDESDITIQFNNVVGGNSVFSLQIVAIVAVPSIPNKSRPFLLWEKSMKTDFAAIPYKQTIIQNLINSAYTVANTKNLTVPQRWGAWGGNYFGKILGKILNIKNEKKKKEKNTK